MNTKKFLYGLMAFLFLAVTAACTQNTADDATYEQGIEKEDITIDRHAIEKEDITIDRHAIEKEDITIERQ